MVADNGGGALARYGEVGGGGDDDEGGQRGGYEDEDCGDGG